MLHAKAITSPYAHAKLEADRSYPLLKLSMDM
jgi:hypothetical protein